MIKIADYLSFRGVRLCNRFETMCEVYCRVKLRLVFDVVLHEHTEECETPYDDAILKRRETFLIHDHCFDFFNENDIDVNDNDFKQSIAKYRSFRIACERYHTVDHGCGHIFTLVSVDVVFNDEEPKDIVDVGERGFAYVVQDGERYNMRNKDDFEVVGYPNHTNGYTIPGYPRPETLY